MGAWEDYWNKVAERFRQQHNNDPNNPSGATGNKPPAAAPDTGTVPGPVATANPHVGPSDSAVLDAPPSLWPANQPNPVVIPNAGSGGTPSSGNIMPVVWIAGALFAVHLLNKSENQ